MSIRKAIWFKSILGLTLPVEYTNSIGVKRGQYFEVYLANAETIVIKKHTAPIQKIRESDIVFPEHEQI